MAGTNVTAINISHADGAEKKCSIAIGFKPFFGMYHQKFPRKPGGLQTELSTSAAGTR